MKFNEVVSAISQLGLIQVCITAWRNHRKRIDAGQRISEQLKQIKTDVNSIKTTLVPLQKGEVEVLHGELDGLCRKIIEDQGYSTEQQFNRLESIYSAYHNLGGNGSRTKIYTQAKNLPIKEINTDD